MYNTYSLRKEKRKEWRKKEKQMSLYLYLYIHTCIQLSTVLSQTPSYPKQLRFVVL